MLFYSVIHMVTELGFELVSKEKRSQPQVADSDSLKVQHLTLPHEKSLLCREVDLRIGETKSTVTVKSSPFVF